MKNLQQAMLLIITGSSKRRKRRYARYVYGRLLDDINIDGHIERAFGNRRMPCSIFEKAELSFQVMQP